MTHCTATPQPLAHNLLLTPYGAYGSLVCRDAATGRFCRPTTQMLREWRETRRIVAERQQQQGRAVRQAIGAVRYAQPEGRVRYALTKAERRHQQSVRQWGWR